MTDSPDTPGDDGVEEEQELTLPEVLAIAKAFHAQGQLDEAEQLYRALLEAAPDYADALSFLGILSDQRGRSAEAEKLLTRAVELVPDFPDFTNNRGIVLKGMGRLREAEDAFRRVLALAPDHREARNNLGSALTALGRLEEAEAVFAESIRRWPDHWVAYFNVASVLIRLDRIREAVAARFEAVCLAPHVAAPRDLLIRALSATGRTEEALRYLDRWLAEEPENPKAVHLRAALSGDGVPDRTSDELVRQIFDSFADHFDKRLAGLEYRAPELVGEALHERLPPPEGSLDCLDAGCGTGLCGAFVRPYARALTGVDLSHAMLQKAAQRGVYDSLVEAELTAFLGGRTADLDVIVSSDTLCYFGDLAPVIAAAAGALRPGGWLAFTLERAEPEAAPDGFSLKYHGRYCHSEPYVLQCLADAGLSQDRLRRATLRLEEGVPVDGLVLLARRPEEPPCPTC